MARDRAVVRRMDSDAKATSVPKTRQESSESSWGSVFRHARRSLPGDRADSSDCCRTAASDVASHQRDPRSIRAERIELGRGRKQPLSDERRITVNETTNRCCATPSVTSLHSIGIRTKIDMGIACALAMIALTLVPSCGGSSGGQPDGSGGAGGGSGGSSGNAVTNSLNGLGIDTSATPRQSESGSSLPQSYNPLGHTLMVDPLMEIYIGGMPLAGSTAAATLVDDFSQSPIDPNKVITPTTLFQLSTTDAPWWTEQLPGQSPRETKRAVAAADVDGDGLQEIATVFVEDSNLLLQIVHNTGSGFAASTTTLLTNTPGITNVAIVGGDFDGDGKDDLAVGYVVDSVAYLVHLVRDDAGNFSVETSTMRTFAPNLDGSSMQMILRAGNIDDDDPLELVVLLNETAGNSSNPNITSRYVVLDDRTKGYQELTGGFVEGFEAGVGLHVAGVADVALGDIDGDSRDEIVFGGLAYLAHNCDPSPFVMVALDDAVHSFAPLGAKRMDVYPEDCEDTSFELRFVHVRTLDVDGDGVAEVMCNQLVFDDWKNAAPWTQVPAYSLPGKEFIDKDGEEWCDETNCAVAVGDVTGDGRDDILIYHDGHHEVRVWSLPQSATQIGLFGKLPTAGASGLVNPVLLSVNVDKDSKVLQATGVHTFAYIEPIVAAALAAPPAKFGIGQNTDVCQTTFGNTSTSGSQVDTSVSFSVAGLVGVKVDTGILQDDLELNAKISKKLTLSLSHAYTLDKTINFTTGPNEDTVVFTTVPIDIYQYKILQHPDPTLIGKLKDILLPRDPIYLQVERGYYNAHVAPGSPVIDDKVFHHHIGDPWSYPTHDEKDQLLGVHHGLTLGPQAVGQGAGQTELQLDVGQSWNSGGALELGYELEAKTTIETIECGITIGSSVSAGISFSSGQSTTYAGVVGSIDAAHYESNQYQFGLFTYPQLDSGSGRQFEVINYWVQ
jgi:hypothetical protein